MKEWTYYALRKRRKEEVLRLTVESRKSCVFFIHFNFYPVSAISESQCLLWVFILNERNINNNFFIFVKRKCLFSQVGFWGEIVAPKCLLNWLLVVGEFGFGFFLFPMHVGFGRKHDTFKFFSLKIEQLYFLIWRGRGISDAVSHYFWRIILLCRLV